MEDLYASLAKAQGDMCNAVFNRVNTFHKNKYADLGAIRNAVIPSLSKYGVALSQIIEQREDRLFVITLLMKGGDQIRSECPIYIKGPQVTPHELGSALTYVRRYAMAAIAGVAADDDDDGNLAQEVVVPIPQAKQNLSRTKFIAQPSTRPAKQLPVTKIIDIEYGDPLADGTLIPNWQAFVELLSAEIKNAKDLPTINSLLKHHAKEINRLSTDANSLHEELKELTENQRTEIKEDNSKSILTISPAQSTSSVSATAPTQFAKAE